MKKKYELILSDKEGLFRIQALRDFGDVKKGDIGGYVSGEHNLSHKGDCWIYDIAVVRDNAKVCGNAKVFDNVVVSGNAMVSGNAKVGGDACVYGYAWVSGNAVVYGSACMYGSAVVYGSACVYGSAVVRGNAEVSDFAWVYGDAHVYGNAVVRGKVEVYGNADISGNAVVSQISDYLVFKNHWSSGRYFTYTRSNNMWKVGCFHGTGEELINKAYKDSEESGREYERIVKYVEETIKK